MTKITRQTQKIFANAAANNGVIGSGQDGTKVLTNNLATLQSKGAWDTGWLTMVLGTKKFPPLEEFQALDYINTYQLSYLFQEGIPEYDSGTTYFQNSIVKKPGTYQLYGSVTNTNVGNVLTDATKWVFLTDLSVSFSTDIFNFAADTGAANHFVIAPNPVMSAMTAGNTIFIKPNHNITGACDVSPNAVATAPVKLFDGSNPVAGMMVTTGIYCLVSDGTNWILQNPSYPNLIQKDINGNVPDGLGVVKSVKTRKITATGTYVPSAGMLYCIVKAQAAGGGGGGANGNAACAVGGGAGSYSESTLSAATVGASQAVTIGAGGVAGASSGGNGGDGGDTSFGSLVTTNGGKGGTGSTNNSSQYTIAAVAGGAIGVGDITIPGQWSAPAFSGNNGPNMSGAGGNAVLGFGGTSVTGEPGSSVGRDGQGYGGGGSGATTNFASDAGGVGAPGVIIVTEYCSQ